MYDGISGKEFEADIFIGTVYYQRLRHMISDKFQVRYTTCDGRSIDLNEYICLILISYVKMFVSLIRSEQQDRLIR